MRRKIQIHRSPPRTDEEIDRLLDSYFAEQDRGSMCREAAKTVGVSQKTLNRWIAERKQDADAIHLQPDGLSVSEAIEILCRLDMDAGSTNTFNELKKVEALATFAAWLRWPRLRTSLRLGVISYLTAYMYKKYGLKRLSELDPPVKEFMEKFIRLDFLSVMCSSRHLDFPIFYRFHDLEVGPQNENACLADIVWYVISHGRDPTNSRKNASLGKAVYLANKNAFRYHWSASSFSIRKLLRDRSPAAPFLYAEQKTYLSIPLEIDADDFCESVSKFLKDNDERVRYFAQARWICQRLQSILDTKALARFCFPDFPSGLKPAPFDVEPLTETVLMLLQSYQSADKTLDWQDNFYDEY